jgi:hypothetical protein
MSSQGFSSIHNHAANFRLVSNLTRWFKLYWDYRIGSSTPEHDRMDKSYSILYATMQTLAEAKQLRVKRFAGFTGLGYECKWYHEIQILDQQGQVATTIIGSIIEHDIHYGAADMILIKGAHLPVEGRNDIVVLTLVLPSEFPNLPEFRNDDGNPLHCDYRLHCGRYYVVCIKIHKEYITDEFVTEEMRQENVRKHAMSQCKIFKEELMINRWSPARVEKLLLAGYDVEDM